MSDDQDPRIVDNGNGDISVLRGVNRLAGWTYTDTDIDRPTATMYARIFIAGWNDGYHRSRMDAYAARLRERNAQAEKEQQK